MASFLKKLFGYQDKRDTSYTGNRPQSIGQMPSYQTASDVLRSIRSPEDYASMYEKELYRPTQQAANYQWQTYGRPEAEESLQRSGLGLKSSAAQENLARRGTDLATQLALARADQRAQGLNTGIDLMKTKLSGASNLLGQELNQSNRMADFDMQDYGNQLGIAQNRQSANQAALGRALQFGSQFIPQITGGASSLLTQLRSGGTPTGQTLNYGGVEYPVTTPKANYNPSNWWQRLFGGR